MKKNDGITYGQLDQLKELEQMSIDTTSSQTIAKPNVIGSVPCAYWVTSHLRYAKKAIRPDEQTVKYELRLQQMWQGQDGSQKWEWVEVFE